MTTPPLAKKTKSNILSAYEDLLKKYEEVRATAVQVADPKVQELLTKAQGYTGETIAQSTAAVRETVNRVVRELTEKMVAEAQKLVELQAATDIVQKRLETAYHVQVAAESLDTLVRGHDVKRQQFEGELARRNVEADIEIANKKREWEREREDREYAAKLQLKRERAQMEEEFAERERALAARGAALEAQEKEQEALKKQVGEIPAMTERATKQREKEVADRLKAEFATTLAQSRREWEAAKNLLEVRIRHVEEQLGQRQAEVAFLKEERERAAQKMHELAVKVIEGSAGSSGRVMPEG